VVAGNALAPGQIVFVDIPDQGPHPVVVVLAIGNGGYIVANGTGAPQDEQPAVAMSEAVAKRCGLTKPTAFYASRKFVWYWRPGSEDVRVVGSMLPTHLADLRAATTVTLKTFTNILTEIGKLPAEAGVALANIKALVALQGT
jgi:hypothetical protein